MKALIRPFARSIPSAVPRTVIRGQFQQIRHESTGWISTEQIAAQFNEYHVGKSYTRTQYLDANQIALLSCTLNRPDPSTLDPQQGDPVPPGWHLVYFTPRIMTSDLAPDGSDATFNPGKPFTRRMWAGGEMIFERENELTIGDTVTETTVLESCDIKHGAKGGEMLVVGVRKTFENERGLAVTDKRNWVFLKAGEAAAAEGGKGKRGQKVVDDEARREAGKKVASDSKLQNASSHDTTPLATRTVTQDPATLFRYSALTFNGHKIHYNTPWTQTQELHPDIVVHGPLNLTLLLDFWRDTHAKRIENLSLRALRSAEYDVKEEEDKAEPRIKSVKYRAMTPVYAGERYELKMRDVEQEGNTSELWVEKENGAIGMKAFVESWA
ncbi:hypothetical protein YB2330_002144 [Saitoella coloradoensis]